MRKWRAYSNISRAYRCDVLNKANGYDYLIGYDYNWWLDQLEDEDD